MKKYIDRLYKNDKESYYKILENDLKNNAKKFIVTVNPETLIIAEKDLELKKILDDDSVSLVPDGIAVVKASKWLNAAVKERITGVDIAEKLLSIANENKYSLYLFGAKKEVIKKLVDKISSKYQGIRILGASNGYAHDKDKIMKEIVKLKPDICMVALGIPMQEKIIYKYLSKFNKGIFIGVGGSFDVLSDSKKRAPKFFIKTNTEWLYRIVTEPKRLKRFWNNNIKFVLRVFKIKNNNNN